MARHASREEKPQVSILSESDNLTTFTSIIKDGLKIKAVLSSNDKR